MVAHGLLADRQLARDWGRCSPARKKFEDLTLLRRALGKLFRRPRCDAGEDSMRRFAMAEPKTPSSEPTARIAARTSPGSMLRRTGPAKSLSPSDSIRPRQPPWPRITRSARTARASGTPAPREQRATGWPEARSSSCGTRPQAPSGLLVMKLIDLAGDGVVPRRKARWQRSVP